MKEKIQEFFSIPDEIEKASDNQKLFYKFMRGLGWVSIGIGVISLLAMFASVVCILIAIIFLGLGLVIFPIANGWIKQVNTPEFKEKRQQELAAREAGWAALGAVTKTLITPSSTTQADNENNIEEEYIEEDFENNLDSSQNNIPQTSTASSTPKRNKGGTTMIKKNMSSLKAHLGTIDNNAAAALPDILSSMTDDEEILYAFKSMMLERNHGKPGRDSITDIVNILTNKRYYFAGTDGQSAFFAKQLKSGSVALRDVHATNAGTITMQGAYVGFETQNDDYKIWLGAGVKSGPIKAWFDEAIRKAQESVSGTTTIQAALSPADELKKFKELLDMGVLTQEEFDAKKKQLLNL